MWEERSAQIHTWVHPSTPHRPGLPPGTGAAVGGAPSAHAVPQTRAGERTQPAGRPCRRGPAAGATEAGSGRHRVDPTGPADIRGRTPHGGAPAARVDSASQTPLSRAGSQQTFGRSPPPAPRPRCPLPADSYLGAGRQSPRPGGRPGSLPRRAPHPARHAGARARPAQTAGAAAPGGVRCPAHRRTGPALIGQTARPPRRRPIRARDSRPEGAGPRRAGGSRGAFPPAARRAFDAPAPRSSQAGGPHILPSRGLGFL